MPAELQQAPELEEHLWFYFHAFTMLSTTRSNGFSEGMISVNEIYKYARNTFCTEEQTEELLYSIPEMDLVYMKFRSEEMKKKNEKKV